jgi:hypothetical protein
LLTTNDMVIIRAALRYWEEEMCPHGREAMQPYFDVTGIEPLSTEEIQQLRRKFDPTRVRYIAYDAIGDEFQNAEVLSDAAEAAEASESGLVATVLLP